MLTINWGFREQAQEAYRLLKRWAPLPPHDALQLLSLRFPDPKVRVCVCVFVCVCVAAPLFPCADVRTLPLLFDVRAKRRAAVRRRAAPRCGVRARRPRLLDARDARAPSLSFSLARISLSRARALSI